MDEADRCHKIIYILNGQLIAQGELSEIINQTGLISALIRSISQENLKLIEKKILESGIAEGITYLGEALKINVNKEKQNELIEILENNFGDHQLQIDFASPTMEDSFIFFMKNQGFSK
jgi:ABC-2 type transport system ATP-binding protein